MPLCRLPSAVFAVVGVSGTPGVTHLTEVIVVTAPPGKVDVSVLVLGEVTGLFVLVVPEVVVVVPVGLVRVGSVFVGWVELGA